MYMDLVRIPFKQGYRDFQKKIWNISSDVCTSGCLTFCLFDTFLPWLHLHKIFPIPACTLYTASSNRAWDFFPLSLYLSACLSSVISKDIWATSPPGVTERNDPDSLPPEWATRRVAYFLHSLTPGNKTVQKKLRTYWLVQPGVKQGRNSCCAGKYNCIILRRSLFHLSCTYE